MGDNRGEKAENRTVTGKKPPTSTTFRKGQTGNPKGRPKVPTEVKEILKAAAPGAAKLLVEMVADETQKPELRIKCAETVLDRVYGKAVQPIDGALDVSARMLLGDLDADKALEALGYVKRG